MIRVGIDDTDLIDTPGTNQLARHLVEVLRDVVHARMVLRHQLLEDPRVPCTRKNGCASIEFEPVAPILCEELADRIAEIILEWIPDGSDPGLCVVDGAPVPEAVVDWGCRAQRELLDQQAARQLAASHGLILRGLAGTEDGVIGALAAVGLMATRNDGRVVYLARDADDLLDINGELPVATLLSRGIVEIRDATTHARIEDGVVAVRKKIRPNLRENRVVLFAARIAEHSYEAVRVP